MSSDLDLLINFYQWEKQRLLLEIDENKRDQDYLAVHHMHDELRYVQNELDCLLELRNANHRKIQRLKRNIDSYTEEDASGYFKPQIDQYKRELEELNKKRPIAPEETQILDEALFSLVNEEIEGFTVYFDLKKQAYIDVVKIETGQIQLTLAEGTSKGGFGFLKEYMFKDKPKLILDGSSKSLVALLNVDRYKNVLPIKETISRIVIGSKYWLGLDDTIFLKLKP